MERDHSPTNNPMAAAQFPRAGEIFLNEQMFMLLRRTRANARLELRYANAKQRLLWRKRRVFAIAIADNSKPRPAPMAGFARVQ
jgi:hypothetical protein